MIAHVVLFALVAAGFAIACRINLLRAFIVVQLAMIGFTGVHATVLGPLTINAGAALYAAVIPALIAIHARHGQSHTWKAVKTAVFADVLLIALSSAIHNLEPAMPGPMADAIVRVTAWPAQVAVASVLAFIAAAATTVAVLRLEWPRRLAWPSAIIMAQLVDSIVFFPVALPELDARTVAGVILAGWLLKSLAGLALLPVVAGAVRMEAKLP